jgi:signal transduction histidine kinase
MRIPLKILVGFAVELFLFTALLAVSHYTIKKMLAARQLAIHTRQVIEGEENLLADLISIEAEEWGYAISGRQNLLEPLNREIDAVRGDCEVLEVLLTNDAKQRAALNDFEREYRHWLETEIYPLIALRREINSGLRPAQAVVEFIDSENGEKQMETMRRMLARMIEEEHSLFHGSTSSTSIFANWTRELLVFGGLAGIFLGVLISLYTAWSITSPLKDAVDYAEKVAAGDFTARLDFHRDDEIGILVASLHLMVEKLTHHISLLNFQSENLKKVTRELFLRNQELEDFASVAAHDLQEPLRKIQAFGGLIEIEKDQLSEKNIQILNRIVNAANRMQSLIIAITEYTSVTKAPDAFVAVDLNVVISRILDDIQEHISETRGVIEVGTLPILRAEPAQMRYLFQNLLSNALKFTRADIPPEIRVHGKRTKRADGKDYWEIAISDNGIGFNDEYLDKIFKPFQRLHGKEYEGTGIGLAICKRIVANHNGLISARGVPGVGSTFIVTLPVEL